MDNSLISTAGDAGNMLFSSTILTYSSLWCHGIGCNFIHECYFIGKIYNLLTIEIFYKEARYGILQEENTNRLGQDMRLSG